VGGHRWDAQSYHSCIRAYFDIDTDLVCDTLVDDLPRLIRDLEGIVSTERGDEP
jgi:uncharacterized protein with HEPN domain